MSDSDPNPTVAFLTRLHKLDKLSVTPRDVILLYAIICQPGGNGKEMARKIGIAERSAIQLNIARLIRFGFIEDRREAVGNTIPNRLYVTKAGEQFWSDLKP